MAEIKPLIEFRDDVLKLYMLYLETVDDLTYEEREVFCDYFRHLSNPVFIVEDKT